MIPALSSLRVLGVHPVIPAANQLREALEIMWGPRLKGRALADAERGVREHFAGLFLLEIEVEPCHADVDWSRITQPIEEQPREDWQVPWDERPIGDRGNRWAFFLHYVQLTQPLLTPLGERALPKPTPVPRHLEHIQYEVPG